MSRGHLVLEHAIDQIVQGRSYRRDLGDLEELSESIQRLGLLSPISITTSNVLISGKRRLAVLRDLGHRNVAVWVIPGVSDRLSEVLAIQDENTLHKMLTPIEQSELYEELKGLYAEDAAAREKAHQFGPGGTLPGEDEGGRVDSTQPLPAGTSSSGRSRVQAAKAVTGRDSHGMLDQVVELRTIAANDDEDPLVRQLAAEALLELNADGKVNGRYLQVKTEQALTTLARWAQHPDEPDPVRAAATAALEVVRAEASAKDALKEATRAITEISELRTQTLAQAPAKGWGDVDPFLKEKHQVRKLVDLLRREHGWWNRFDPEIIAAHADEEQWQLIDTYAAGAAAFVDAASKLRSALGDA